ncbi:MAG: cytochrome c biogenesis protein CcdA [Candidatus Firestonebacteria bacterium]|nr:cytochrome c biogenesis protein CcdA [Candidatus Firestonebacteria bacterium]
MLTENLNLLWVFTAGLTSVFSPCVLPILPILVAGTQREHRARPLLIVAGLTTTFVLMGIVSSLFGALIGPGMYYVEKGAGILIAVFGVLMLFDINWFKHLTFLSGLTSRSEGKFGGLLLGLTLGIVWIPCVGPMLSSVLALVAARGTTGYGAGLLLVYSLGFSLPILLAAYAAHFFRNQVGFFKTHPTGVRIASGILLIVFGLFIFFKGMIAFGSL